MSGFTKLLNASDALMLQFVNEVHPLLDEHCEITLKKRSKGYDLYFNRILRNDSEVTNYTHITIYGPGDFHTTIDDVWASLCWLQGLIVDDRFPEGSFYNSDIIKMIEKEAKG